MTVYGGIVYFLVRSTCSTLRHTGTGGTPWNGVEHLERNGTSCIKHPATSNPLKISYLAPFNEYYILYPETVWNIGHCGISLALQNFFGSSVIFPFG